MTAATHRVFKYDDPTPGAWDEFIKAMHSKEIFECDEEMFNYWLGVLPPVHMARNVVLPNGKEVRASFGFAEGAEEVTVFWRFAERFFGCRTSTVNPYA